jgi:hypothetical protein
MHSALGRSRALRYLQHSTRGRVYLFPFGHRPRMPISRIEDSALLPSCCASEHDPLSDAQQCSRISLVCEWLDPSELHSPYTAFLKAAVASDQSVGRAIVREFRLRFALEFRDDSLGQDLSQFDSPLVEGVDLPDGALGRPVLPKSTT